MGVGLIAVQVADSRRKRAIAATSPASSDKRFRELEAAQVSPASRQEADSAVSVRFSPQERFDRQAWSELVESDPDLSRVASVLADYGKQYVDELAEEYQATLDTQRLPETVDGIIRGARKNASPPGISESENRATDPDWRSWCG
jgi:NADPH:quinone reductase-like Zn-dependent oxidoreductase